MMKGQFRCHDWARTKRLISVFSVDRQVCVSLSPGYDRRCHGERWHSRSYPQAYDWQSEETSLSPTGTSVARCTDSRDVPAILFAVPLPRTIAGSSATAENAPDNPKARHTAPDRDPQLRAVRTGCESSPEPLYTTGRVPLEQVRPAWKIRDGWKITG